MSGPTELVLTTFEPALEELAKRVDAAADPAGTVQAALALFQGIAATALLPGGLPGLSGDAAASRWDGVFEDGRLQLMRPGYQFSATLGIGRLETAVLNGPAANTWTILRSERGLHVTVASPSAGTLHDLFIGLTGEVRDERDVAGKLRQLKDELDEINRRPIESLPDGKPSSGMGSPFTGSAAGALGDLLGQAATGTAIAAAGAATAAVARAASAPPAPPPVAPPRKPAASPASARPSEPPPVKKPAGTATPVSRALSLRLEDGRIIEVEKFPSHLGRTDETEIRLDSNRVSRRHARIDRDGEGFWLTDEGSANGTFRNETKVTTRIRLENGDRLRFADITLTVALTGGESSATGMATVAFQVPESLAEQPAPKPSPVPAPAPKPPAAPVSKPPASRPPAAPPPKAAAPAPLPPLSPVPSPGQESPPSPSQPAGMQKRPCPACGHRCPPEASFCRACGTPLAGASTPCTTCGEPLKPEDTICASCGTACPSLNSGRQQPDGVVQTAPLSNAPSLTGIGFLLGLLLTGQIVMIASNSSPDVLLREQVLIRLAVGYAAALLGFLTGTRGGLSRLLTLLLSGGFVFIEGRRLIPAFNIVANSPDLLSTLAPALGINILFFLTGLWICKRACQFSG